MQGNTGHLVEYLDLPCGKNAVLFGLFEGNSRTYVSKYLKENFKEILVSLPSFSEENYRWAIV